MTSFRFATAIVLVVVGAISANGQTRQIEGTVRDSSGAAIVGATVTLRSGENTWRARTGTAGEFSFPAAPNPASIDVEAAGFTAEHVEVSHPGAVRIVLRPAGSPEQVIVSASRTQVRLSETPGSTVRLSSTDVAATPALMTDDLLRQVPGFTLFRRTGSRTANPTSQGVSLRGLGASGASRALVLMDGVPLLDPFGGWVYWDRVPRAELQSIEVFRGGLSSLYGSSAMGGLVQFLTRQPERPSLVMEAAYGNERTPDLSLWTGTQVSGWDLEAATDLFRSDGYILVPSSDRGAVDTAANSEHGTLDFSAGHKVADDGHLFVRGNFLLESRNNGTRIQTNDTYLASGAVGFDKVMSHADSLLARLYTDVQSYNQNFSSIAADRSSESLTNIQHVPSQNLGGAVQWTHLLHNHTLIGGADLVEVLGESDEQIFSSGTHIANSAAGGRQRTFGLYGEDFFRIRDKWTVIAGVRFDDWHNFNGSSDRTSLTTGTQTLLQYANRSDTALSPRLSVLRGITRNVSVTGSVYRAFRAPTLNELYRSFRQGNVITQNNAALTAERLTGAESGVNLSGLNRRVNVRGTFFWDDIVNPIANVTLSTTPTLITRQRQNLGRTRSRGLELDGTAHICDHIDLSAGYAFTDATVLHFPANTALEGLRLPQVPRNQFTIQGRYWKPSGTMFSVQGRFVGVQFDDDKNLLSLDRYFTVDLTAAHALPTGLTAFIAIENVFDQRYMIARTPVANLGPPILFRIGVRYGFGERTH